MDELNGNKLYQPNQEKVYSLRHACKSWKMNGHRFMIWSFHQNPNTMYYYTQNGVSIPWKNQKGHFRIDGDMICSWQIKELETQLHMFLVCTVQIACSLKFLLYLQTLNILFSNRHATNFSFCQFFPLNLGQDAVFDLLFFFFRRFMEW